MSRPNAESRDPYAKGLISANPFTDKVEVSGEIVALMDLVLPDRGLTLEHFRSRAIAQGMVYELVTTDEAQDPLDRCVNNTGYIGFVRSDSGGVIIVGDDCFIGDKWVGSVIGFDSSHEPNHFSVVVQCEYVRSGVQWGFELGETVVCQFSSQH